MVSIAGSAGAVAFLAAGASGAEATIIGIAALTGLALYNLTSGRAGGGQSGKQIADLSQGTTDLARQVADIGRRLHALEAETRASVDKAVAATRPISAELGELGALLKDLAETVATHEGALRQLAPGSAMSHPPASPAPAAIQPDLTILAAEPVQQHVPSPATFAAAASPAMSGANLIEAGRFKGLDPDAVVALLREAVDANRVDLYLQPIVRLPQRKVRYYEALSRLRADAGDVLAPADFLAYAEIGGLMPRIDNLMLFRCVQVVRRLLSKSRDVGLFCNISATTLVDPEFFPQFTEFMAANRAIAPAIVFEFTQAAFRAMGPIENESLAALADQGFRFSMDHVTDLRIEPRDLADRGVRFVKVPASVMLNRGVPVDSDIHPADFAGLLSRFGIELIATHIEGESSVVDLLDYEVKLGQGFLFSPPRPVRPEVMQGLADRDAVREPSPPPGPSMPANRPMPSAATLSGGDFRTAGQPVSPLAQLAKGVVVRG